jgi:transmembrane sensor
MKKPSKQALLNYFKGNSLVDEQEAIEAYLVIETNTAYVELCLKEAMADTEAYVLPISPKQQDQAWQKFDNRRLDPEINSTPKLNRKWMAYAASVTIFIACVTLTLYLSQSPRMFQSVVVYHRIEAVYGKIDYITLPDSSHLSLFPGTTIDIPSDFNSVNRKVFLNGRAYFEVAHNKRKPFYVLTSKVVTRVLGTSFEVNAKNEAKMVSVLLRTGGVSVSNKSRELAILHPGQKLTFHPATGQYLKEQVQPDQLLTWVNGELAFNQTSFAGICNELEKWYHITIKVQDQQLLKKKITAGFKGQSATQVLDILSATAGFKYKSEKDIIKIY